MITAIYNPDTGEATAKITGTNTIVRTELKALRAVIFKDVTLTELWVRGLEEDVEELRRLKEEEEKKEETE